MQRAFKSPPTQLTINHAAGVAGNAAAAASYLKVASDSHFTLSVWRLLHPCILLSPKHSCQLPLLRKPILTQPQHGRQPTLQQLHSLPKAPKAHCLVTVTKPVTPAAADIRSCRGICSTKPWQAGSSPNQALVSAIFQRSTNPMHSVEPTKQAIQQREHNKDR